jgi:hypothetical protein
MAGATESRGSGLIDLVRRGMRVVDADGAPVGPVEYVQLGDPAAVTTAGAEMPVPATWALAEAAMDRYAEPDVPEPLRSRLLREGFVKIDGPGPDLLDTDLYVRADAIASVAGDTVTLTLRKEQLIVEGLGAEPAGDAAPVPAGALWWVVGRST